MGGNNLFEMEKHYIGMICLQFGYAGMNILAKLALDRGMSHYVFVVYRQAFATAAVASSALILERKVRPKMTFTIFMHMFVMALLGPVIDQNLYYAGLKLTSPTFSCAITSMLPPITFLMALLCRMEKVHMKDVRCWAKVVGTLATPVGAMLITLYKGHVISMISSTNHQDWVKGSALLIIATFSWASFFILQAITMRKYTAQLSLIAIVCFLGTLQSTALSFVMEQTASVWSIGWDMNLFAAAYAGIVSSGIAYYVQGIVMEKRGPFFVTAFSPLMTIIVAILGSFILAEKLHLGGILGAVLIVSGLYSVLWGKYKEMETEEVNIVEPRKDIISTIIIQEIEINVV